MRGTVKYLNKSKKSGLIEAENGTCYCFVLAKVKSPEIVLLDTAVTFRLIEGKCGVEAVDVQVEGGFESKVVPEFIEFGDIKLRVDAIKTYGIVQRRVINAGTEEEHYRQAIVKGRMLRIWGFSGRRVNAQEDIYLYVTTGRDGDFEFYENKVSFDIFKKCQELDRYLS